MKRLIPLIFAVLFAVCASVSAGAEAASFVLTESTMAQLGTDIIEYMPEQKMFHFTKYGSVSAEIPAAGGIYLYVTAGGYRSDSNGVTDNGINHVCDISVECLDSGGNPLSEPPITGVKALCPADGVFYMCRIGTDEMYAGISEDVSTVRLTVTGLNDTAYIKSMYIVSDDTKARNISDTLWHQSAAGNINAQTRPIDHFIMVGGVFAAALAMFLFKKWRDRIKKGK